MPDYKNTEEPVEELVGAGSEIAGGAAGAAIGLLIGGPTGAVLGGAGGPAVARAIRHLAIEFNQRVLGEREEARVGATIAFGVEKVQQNITNGQQVRQDSFFQEQFGDRAAAEEIFEGVLLVAQREYQEKKLRFYGNLVANIAFHPEIDRDHANVLIKAGEEVSYRQMCLLALFILRDRGYFALRRGDYRGGVEISFTLVVLLEEIYQLFQRGVLGLPGDTLLGVTDVNPAGMKVYGTGTDLYNLMELWEIDAQDLSQLALLLQ